MGPGPLAQGRNERGKRAQFPKRQVTMRAPNHCWGAERLRRTPKSPNNVARTFFNTVHLLPKDLSFENGGAKLASCPGHHLTSLHPWVWFHQIIGFHLLRLFLLIMLLCAVDYVLAQWLLFGHIKSYFLKNKVVLSSLLGHKKWSSSLSKIYDNKGRSEYKDQLKNWQLCGV